MITFQESDIEFRFNTDEWSLLKKADAHPDYKKLEKLNKSKAVDFIGFCNNELFFIEVKSFKKGKTTKTAEVLTTEVGIKVKDTVACFVGGARNSTNDKSDWVQFANHAINENRQLSVVFIMDEDKSSLNKRTKSGYGIYTNLLKTKLKWLTGGNKVIIVSSSEVKLPGLTLSSI